MISETTRCIGIQVPEIVLDFLLHEFRCIGIQMPEIVLDCCCMGDEKRGDQVDGHAGRTDW